MRISVRNITVIAFLLTVGSVSTARALLTRSTGLDSGSLRASGCTPTDRVSSTVFLQCYYREDNRYTKSGYISHVVIKNAGNSSVIYSIVVHTDQGDKTWSYWPMDVGEERDISIDTARISGIHIEYRPT